MILSKDTLRPDFTGDDRFKLIAHNVTPTEIARAEAIVVMIDGRVAVLKSKNGIPFVEVSASPREPIAIYPAQNGGFVLLEKDADIGRIPKIIAACSDLTDLLDAVELYYQRDEVLSGDTYVKDSEPDFEEVGEERTATDSAAPPTGNGGNFYYVLFSGSQDDSEKNVTVFCDEDAMKRARDLVRCAGGKAWGRAAPLI